MTGDPFDAPVLASQEHPSRVLRRLSRSPGYPERLTADLGTRVEVSLVPATAIHGTAIETLVPVFKIDGNGL